MLITNTKVNKGEKRTSPWESEGVSPWTGSWTASGSQSRLRWRAVYDLWWARQHLQSWVSAIFPHRWDPEQTSSSPSPTSQTGNTETNVCVCETLKHLMNLKTESGKQTDLSHADVLFASSRSLKEKLLFSSGVHLQQLTCRQKQQTGPVTVLQGK